MVFLGRRRDFIMLLGAASLSSPLVAQAQQSGRIAVLMNNAEDDPEGQARGAAFRQGLQALGWTEGSNLRIDWYWTAGDIARIRSDVMELARDAPDIIVANGRVILSQAVQVIRSIPIVFVLVTDPVGQGFISSLARPGSNVTGFTFFEYAMFGKSLELLKKVAPAVTRVGFIFIANPARRMCRPRSRKTWASDHPRTRRSTGSYASVAIADLRPPFRPCPRPTSAVPRVCSARTASSSRFQSFP